MVTDGYGFNFRFPNVSFGGFASSEKEYWFGGFNGLKKPIAVATTSSHVLCLSTRPLYSCFPYVYFHVVLLPSFSLSLSLARLRLSFLSPRAFVALQFETRHETGLLISKPLFRI